MEDPENLTSRQQAKHAWVAKTDPRLHQAYLHKEGLGLVFQLPYDEATEALEVWIGWARRCRISAFVDLQRRIVKHRDSILAAIEHGLSNGRIESVNTKIRLITRSRSASAHPKPLSRWPCSTSAWSVHLRHVRTPRGPNRKWSVWEGLEHSRGHALWARPAYAQKFRVIDGKRYLEEEVEVKVSVRTNGVSSYYGVDLNYQVPGVLTAYCANTPKADKCPSWIDQAIGTHAPARGVNDPDAPQFAGSYESFTVGEPIPESATLYVP